MTVEFRVLGELQLLVDGIDRGPSAPKVRQVLALLLAKANHVVQAESIIAEVWDGEPPASASTTTQTYIYQLRKLFAEHGVRAEQGDALTTRGNGYHLALDPTSLDENVFRDGVERGRRLLEEGRHRDASTALRQALQGWSSTPFSGVEKGRLLQGHTVNLEELHQRAVELRIEAEMSAGQHRELIGELRMLVTEQPLNEWLHGKLMQALGRAGRRSEALTVYQSMRRLLDSELGLRPSAETRQLQAELLNA